MAVSVGSKVKVEYTGRFNDGTVFDKSKEGEPLEFVLGDGRLIAGFEVAVEDMSLNEQKTITIAAENAYGPRDESLVRKFGKNLLPDNLKPQNGMVLTLHLPNGGSVPATIMDVSETDIVVDLNHPMAGKELIFDIKLVSVEPKV
ncbi:MAG TPA: peptidylprolyl isomerase [Elusimicrobia bacterium]|nr:MAG: hypothetical protein A2278_06805 [Elusimicrobia bacterium RIFOXYA12_FULL_49_49]OGS08663.1 MAG: hypothetical protein A2204_03410 [Elusimicrobia bacterium RIFOXYA1_FULL_47_7]OGS11501.1 MAG: hypothetical protein A2386_04005 [Elusimicrobia bacterium RIFOXYB1_FULL_48_9]OGS16247.1 MAG: hypothetical protein A2251_01380 [Elusimicrobia bacterium RIFOXYA2_FULL_47_53]OGS26210.1 MAG: hypothetical protein A2339_02715 [Elusimicrobia bacterium RIFOXYB12_FULL_50_12]OGS31402.1 MAG: hypothetical protein